MTVKVNEILKINTTTDPEAKVTFKSSKKKIATVTKDGIVKGIKKGKATITVKANGITKKVKVKVINGTLTLDQSTINMKINETSQITYTDDPATLPKFKTSSKTIATVDANGLVTACQGGTATITVTVNGTSKKVKVIVEMAVITVDATSLTLKKGETYQINATVEPDGPFTYSTSKKKYAKVSSTGLITAVKKGNATITVKAYGVSKKIKVKVTN